jgi:pimeloyl-ACP methyl ester carboxylesterase
MSVEGPVRRVVLVHGIWNQAWWLAPLAWRLRRAGFAPELFGYASLVQGGDAAVQPLARRLAAGPPAHVVGHSLGGLVALEALRGEPGLPVQRVVCLGSPLCGSGTARHLAGRRGLAWALGRSAGLLERGCLPWPGGPEVGVVAGDVPRGIGRLLAAVGTQSDGTVALAETCLPGVTDHCRVPASHTGLVLSAQAARQTLAFLQWGRFLVGSGPSPAGTAGPV